ncbi:MAG: hypothetical protein ACD_62C00530G0001 [uncultured bacterium]|nr:MAG: hypothetical protein ACD_62C00530G0001 [uncultured bacterium]HLD46123.1 hypothetical protein [bacterium]
MIVQGSFTDHFVANPVLQPKLAVANYVASQGFLVPTRYDSLDEALESQKPFIMRSEHPQDYAGASGLMQSYFVKPDVVSSLKMPINHFETNQLSRTDMISFLNLLGPKIRGESVGPFDEAVARLSSENMTDYCHYMGLSEELFIKDISYSYWMEQTGFNISIVADNTIPGRYHITLRGKGVSYILREGNDVLKMATTENDTAVVQAISTRMVPWYEAIRSLPHFNPQHCPIIEAQFFNGAIYFLQYLRARDFNPAQFVLDRSLEEGEQEALWVRGATSPDGHIFQTAIDYPEIIHHGEYFFPVLDAEAGSANSITSHMYNEIMSRRREVQFCNFGDDKSVLPHIADGHLKMTLLFKPRISLIANVWQNVSPELNEKREAMLEKNMVPRIPVRVVADGRKAYFKVIDWNPT